MSENPIDKIRRTLEKRAKKEPYEGIAKYIVPHEETVQECIKELKKEGIKDGYWVWNRYVKLGIINLSEPVSVAQKRFNSIVEQIKRKEIDTSDIELMKVYNSAKERVLSALDITIPLEFDRLIINSTDKIHREFKEREKEEQSKETVEEYIKLLRIKSVGMSQLWKTYVRDGLINLDDTVSVAKEKIKQRDIK